MCYFIQQNEQSTMKIFICILILIITSCGGKETVLLPQSNKTIISKVMDHSPIYIFFKTEGNDTLAKVNRNNTIGSTNWIFNIDKRLPLHLVVPVIIKLQEKKRNVVAHKNELAENYFSYSDSVGKNLAFLPFTKVYFKENKPKFGTAIFFTKNGVIKVNNQIVNKEKLKDYLKNLPSYKPNYYTFCFDKKLSFEGYIQSKIFIRNLKLNDLKLNAENEEYVY